MSVPAWAQDSAVGYRELWGPSFAPTQAHRVTPRHRSKPRANWGLDWNEIALDANALDHTPVAGGEAHVSGEQFGPVGTSRALAIAHVAMFDAVHAIVGGYDNYMDLLRVHPFISTHAAISQAARDMLAALYPSQKLRFGEELARHLKDIPDGCAKAEGVALGRKAAAAILA